MSMDTVYLFALGGAAAIFLAACVASRPIALAIFCAILPTYLFRLSFSIAGITMPTTFLEIAFLLLALTWLMTDGRKKDAWVGAARYAEPLALLLAASFASVLISPDFRGALGLLRAYVLEPLLFFIIFTDIVRDAKRRSLIFAALAWTLSAIGIIAVYQKITGFGIANPYWASEATRRVTAFYGFPNAIGLFAAPVSVLCLGRGLALLHKRKAAMAAAFFAATALGWLGMLFAVSEGALVGAAVATVSLLLFHRRLRAAALGLVIAGSLAVAVVPAARNYLTNAATLRDDSGSVRRIVWKETSDMLRDHVVFGAGLDGYRSIVAAYHDAPDIEIFMYPHDIVLNFWSELGLLGLAAFAWIVALFFLGIVRVIGELAESLPAAAVLCAMLAVLVHGLVDVPYFKNDLSFLFWIIIALAESMRMHPPKLTVLHALRDVFDRGTLARQK